MLQSPFSSTNLLLRRGKEVRILAIILLIQMFPVNNGDFFQIFAKTEWNMTTAGFSSLIAMFGILGILSNMTASVLVPKLGIKRFTSIAILCSACTPIGILFGFKGTVIGMSLGFLGMAQTLGTISQLMSQGEKSGVPRGELTGERSSLLALMKIIGPVLYSTLYIRGQKLWGVGILPFIFNIGLCITAFIICQLWFPIN